MEPLEPSASQRMSALVHATTHITEVLEAQSKRHAADAALPGLPPASHSIEVAEGEEAMARCAVNLRPS